jgi:hypothetical protein
MHPAQPPLGWSPKTDSPQNARNRPTLAHQGWNDLGLHKSMYNRPVKGIHNFTSLPFLSPVHLSLSLSLRPSASSRGGGDSTRNSAPCAAPFAGDQHPPGTAIPSLCFLPDASLNPKKNYL